MIVTSPTGTATPATTIASATDWRTAATDLICWMVANGRCFSSGEIAAYLRTYRPDLAFKVTTLGEFTRDAYDNGQFPNYADAAGNSIYPTQVPRTSTGIARTLDGRTVTSKTPVGQPVFVYATDGAEGFAHDFEVFIPDYDDPQATRAVDYMGAPPAPTQAPTPLQAQPGAAPSQPSQPPTVSVGVLITGSLKRDDLTAYARPDRRLCVPRAAFEAFVALTGTPLRGGPNGDPVHITFTQEALGGKTRDIVMITRDPTNDSEAYHLWTGRGRVAFLAASTLPAFEPGDKYEITVQRDALIIDLSKKV